MKKFFKLTSLLAVALFAGAVAINAQTVTKMEAEIAFDFAVGGKTLDAGKYEVRVARNTAGGASVIVLNDEGKVVQSVLAMYSGDIAKKSAELVFTRQQGQWALAKVNLLDSGVAVQPAARVRYSADVKTD
ncbi:MAG TPA: hypothetical protein PKE66_01015 [Pyrinomonadaceae bacterium]|nr:hypothetical protein [Pyrinomonadaceae bacterium]